MDYDRGYAIRLYGDPILRKEAASVSDVSDDVRALADGMVKTMRREEGVGLSAPQVGALLRLIVVASDPDDEHSDPIALVNPVVEGKSSDEWEAEEGCLSIPDVYADITRPERITVQALDLSGEPASMEADGWAARVLLHEIDHLNGVLFIDHLGHLRRARLRGQLNRLARLPREGMEGLG